MLGKSRCRGARPAPSGGDRTLTFTLPSGAALYGGFAGNENAREQRDPAAHPTILSGDLDGDDPPNRSNRWDDSYQVVTAANTAPGTRLDGFVVRGGQVEGGLGPAYGAGVVIRDDTLTLENCRILENLASYARGEVSSTARSP